MMKEIVKEHPLRAIVLRFDLRKPTPEFEREGLQAYYNDHDKTWEEKQLLCTHKNILTALDRRIDELHYQLDAMELDLDFLEFTLGLKKSEELPQREGKFSISIGDFRKAVNAHNDAIHELYQGVFDETNWHNARADFLYENETFLPFFEKADSAIHQIFVRYEEVSVDIISLDRDQEEWRTAYAEVERYQDTYFEYAQHVFRAYDKLAKRADAFYARANHANELLIEKYD